MSLTHKLVYIVSVVEFLGKTETQCFYTAAAIESCDLFTEAAVKDTILESDHNIVIFLQVFERFLIDPGYKMRIDDSGCYTCLFFDRFCGLFTELIESAERYYSYFRAVLCDLVLVQIRPVVLYFLTV